MKQLLLIAALSLSGCGMITDYLLKDDTGISVDAQIGDTENKVKTGLGSVGNRIESTTSVEGNSNVVDNATGKFHLKSDKNLTVNVYETNRWLYAIIALFILGKPALRWFWHRHDSHEHGSDSSISSRARDNGNNEERRNNNSGSNRNEV